MIVNRPSGSFEISVARLIASMPLISFMIQMSSCDQKGERTNWNAKTLLPFLLIFSFSIVNCTRVKSNALKPAPDKASVIFPWNRAFCYADQEFSDACLEERRKTWIFLKSARIWLKIKRIIVWKLSILPVFIGFLVLIGKKREFMSKYCPAWFVCA